MNLEQFVVQVVERTLAGYASFRIGVGNVEERVVVWTRAGHSGDGKGVDLFIVLRVYTNPQGLRGSTSVGVELMDHGMDRDALQRIAALIVPGKRADEIAGILAAEGESVPALPGQRGRSSPLTRPRVSQQLTLVYDMRWEDLEQGEWGAYIAAVAASAQRKLRSISSLLVGRVVEVQLGPYEVESPTSENQ